MRQRGYFGIGVYCPKTKENIGTLWRSAQNFGAAFIFTIGRRYQEQASDTLKTSRHIPLYHYIDWNHFLNSRPLNCLLFGVEQSENSLDLKNIEHPERCIYLLGAEDNGLPMAIMEECQAVVHISSPMCLNVAVAGSIVMFDRASKLIPSSEGKS